MSKVINKNGFTLDFFPPMSMRMNLGMVKSGNSQK